MEKEEERFCLYCGKSIGTRKNRLFCDSDCRNDYHNRLRRKKLRIKNEMYDKLNYNRNILSGVLMEGRTCISIDEIKKRGFMEGVVSGYRQNKNKQEYACLDILYHRSKTRIFKIRKKTEGDQ